MDSDLTEKDLYNQDGVLLFAKGNELTPKIPGQSWKICKQRMKFLRFRNREINRKEKANHLLQTLRRAFWCGKSWKPATIF